MILTVTPNTGLDHAIFVRDFAMGQTIRAHAEAWGMGGKATDVSMVLGALGESNVATGFAAGETGRRMAAMLESNACTQCDFVWVGGETRTNYVLIDTKQGSQSTITVAGLVVESPHVTALENRLEKYLSLARCIVLGGSLPEGVPTDFYAGLISRARQAGVPVIFDSSGEALRMGVEALPTIIKPNQDELETLAGHELPDLESVLGMARSLVDRGIELVIATAGTKGLWAVTRRRSVFVPALPVTVANSAGAGDALVAGIASSIARNLEWTEGLRLGVAAAAAVCLTPGTAICRPDDIAELVPQVILRDHP